MKNLRLILLLIIFLLFITLFTGVEINYDFFIIILLFWIALNTIK